MRGVPRIHSLSRERYQEMIVLVMLDFIGLNPMAPLIQTDNVSRVGIAGKVPQTVGALGTIGWSHKVTGLTSVATDSGLALNNVTMAM